MSFKYVSLDREKKISDKLQQGIVSAFLCCGLIPLFVCMCCSPEDWPPLWVQGFIIITFLWGWDAWASCGEDKESGILLQELPSSFQFFFFYRSLILQVILEQTIPHLFRSCYNKISHDRLWYIKQNKLCPAGCTV